MSEQVRQERTQGLKSTLAPQDRSSLVQVYFMPGYPVILDIIEMACIAQETKLINVEVDDAEKILAEHKMSKAFWQVFQALQQKVNFEVSQQLQIDEESAATDEIDDAGEDEQRILRP